MNKRGDLESVTLVASVIVCIVIGSSLSWGMSHIGARGTETLNLHAIDSQYAIMFYEYMRQPLTSPSGAQFADALVANDEQKIKEIMDIFVEQYIGHKACWEVRGEGFLYKETSERSCDLYQQINLDSTDKIVISFILPSSQEAIEGEVSLW